MSRNSEHLSSLYNSIIRLKRELSECRLWVSNVKGNCCFKLINAFERKGDKRIKVDVEGWAEEVQYVSDIRVTTGVYISNRFSWKGKANRIGIWNGYHFV